MIPITQTAFAPGGNCFAAAIASVLEVSIEEVPNLIIGEPWRDYLDRVHAFLATHDLAYIEVKGAGIECGRSSTWGYHLVCANGPRVRPNGSIIQHAVVGCGGRIVHDPHPSREGLMPETADNPWFFGLFVKRFHP